MKLDADHSDVCRFDGSEHGQDNYELVERNMKDIYLNALKKGELKCLAIRRRTAQPQ